jgi:hypothetical protein
MITEGSNSYSSFALDSGRFRLQLLAENDAITLRLRDKESAAPDFNRAELAVDPTRTTLNLYDNKGQKIFSKP